MNSFTTFLIFTPFVLIGWTILGVVIYQSCKTIYDIFHNRLKGEEDEMET